MILFELSPFAKEIVEKTNAEFGGKPITHCTQAQMDHRIQAIEKKLVEIGVDLEEASLFMKMYKKALYDTMKDFYIERRY